MKTLIFFLIFFVSMFVILTLTHKNRNIEPQSKTLNNVDQLYEHRLQEKLTISQDLIDRKNWLINKGVPKENITIVGNAMKIKLREPRENAYTEKMEDTVIITSDNELVSVALHYKKD